MKKIWILFLMFLVSISSYAFTLTCLGNYYSRISQMNVNIYQDLHNNRDGDFYIVTYENEGREYVRMVLGIKDLERLVKELDELKKNFPIYKKIVKDNKNDIRKYFDRWRMYNMAYERYIRPSICDKLKYMIL